MQPSHEERMLAAFAHASIVGNVVNLAGTIATALIWTAQREHSEYVRKHALQSLLYQGMVLLIFIVLMLFWGVCLGLSLLPAAVRPDLYRSSPPGSFWIALIGLALPIGFGILAALYGLYGAFQAYRGKAFFYPLVGRFARQERANSGAAAAPSPPEPAASTSSSSSVTVVPVPAEPSSNATSPPLEVPALTSPEQPDEQVGRPKDEGER